MPRSAARIIVLAESALEPGRPAGGSSGDQALITGVLRGLCVNCDLQYGCTYPKPPRGVWNCDEYV
jgi:hypothetical protein